MTFKQGLQDGIAIGLGYFAVSFSFGIAGSNFLSWPFVTFISMTNLTSAGQFAGLQIMNAAGTFFEMALATFFINLRYSLMAISLSQKVSPSFGTLPRMLLSTGITDEIYAVAMSQDGKVPPRYFLGLMIAPYIGWSTGTLVGAYAGEILPQMVTNALGVALYGMFIAIVVPQMKANRANAIAVAIAVACSLAFHYIPGLRNISVGFSIILCAVIASLFAAIVFPVKEGEDAQ